MADLNVQPKKKSILPWLLLILGIIALLFFLLRGCNKNDTQTTPAADTVSSASTETTTSTTQDNWNDVDFNAPAATYPEVTDKNISVRGNTNYGIYGLGENILFDEGKSTIKADAEQNLKQIAASIEQRYKGANVRVYGYTDAVGSAGYNKELAEQRAKAVSDWLTANGNVPADKLSLQPVGEARPVASNATSEGREQNRRVEIVARGANGQ
ncbi:MAG TPA: OmpA family protein [Segetibacter sp.]|jgi:outer membrane protein OmpA-like peptidoglycan-associated protein